jgi:hypothetical protein
MNNDNEAPTRIGIALTCPNAQGRQLEYGIFRTAPTAYGYPVPQSLVCRYAGYREGNVQTGLPFAGPGAVHLQPTIDFNADHFETVRYFDAKD